MSLSSASRTAGSGSRRENWRVASIARGRESPWGGGPAGARGPRRAGSRSRWRLSRDLLHRVAAELVAQRGVDLRREVALPARVEAREQRRRDDRHRHAALDGVLDGPAALAGVLDPPLDPGQLVAFELERAPRELAEPRADHRALLPEVRDPGVVDPERGGLQEAEALRGGLQDHVLH